MLQNTSRISGGLRTTFWSRIRAFFQFFAASAIHRHVNMGCASSFRKTSPAAGLERVTRSVSLPEA
jgi:hypothetical protein